jgi:hypothetical protein
MIGRRSAVGLVLLCAFAFCAFAAQGAVAQIGTPAVNTTAFTCVKGGGNLDFKDAHCDEKVESKKGSYGHVAIANGTTTTLDVSQESSSKFNASIAGVNSEVTCKKVRGFGVESFIQNTEAFGKDHKVKGTLKAEFTECTVAKPSKCVIKEPIFVMATFEGVEGLGLEKNTMGVEFKSHGAEGVFTELTFENKGAEKCALAFGGKTFLVRGSAIATGKVAPNSKHTGATSVFEDANTMETLEIGFSKASFSSTLTTTMWGDGGNPIALTTAT